MVVRKTGGNPPSSNPPSSNPPSGAEPKAAEERVRGSPKSEYMQPHRVHTSAERRAALERKHAAELENEAMKHMQRDAEAAAVQRGNDVEEDLKLKGVNLDDERKKRGQRDGGDDDRDPDQQKEAAKQIGGEDTLGRYFEDAPEDRLGDLSLTNPNEMKRALGPSVRFAQHAMLLAHQRMKDGMPRAEALAFLAKLYLGVADRSYAQKALREFGHGTGILDLYPTELLAHLFENVPSFVPRVTVGSFFAAVPAAGFEGETGKPFVLRYPPELRVRGFAIKGGECPGYLFEPVDPPGTYQLTFTNAGRFVVLISAIARGGHMAIEELRFEVRRGAEASEEPASMRRARASFVDEEEPRSRVKTGEKRQDLSFVIPRRI